MNTKQFELLVQRRLNLSREVLMSKGEEYSVDDSPFYNFYAAGRILNTNPTEALLGMLSKHLVQVFDIAAGKHKDAITQDLLDEKIGDTINYLILLEGLIVDMEASMEVEYD